jgi:peptide deformylase
MIKNIITYPQTPSLEFNIPIRKFDNELKSIVQDIKDTIDANKLDGLAGFQIGYYQNVIVIKIDNDLVEMINPSIMSSDGDIQSVEKTAYFPNLSAKIKRAKNIKVVYQDIDGNQKFLEASDNLAILIQRKIDYMFGSNFRVRMDEIEKSTFDAKLTYGTDDIENNGCPIVFKRDRILQAIKYMLIGGAVGVVGSFVLPNSVLPSIIYIENILMFLILLSTIVYFFYAQYEGKEYKQCTSCQIGNIMGTSLIQVIRLFILFLANYFLVW